MTFGERLTRLRIEHGYEKRKAFADTLGIPSTTLRNYETDVREPGYAFLKHIADLFDVSVDYLLGVTDDPGAPEDFLRLNCDEQEHIRKYRVLDDYGRDMVQTVLNKEHRRCLQNAVSAQAVMTELPLYVLPTSAGPGQFLDSDDYEITAFPNVPAGTNFAVTVSGDSMEPHFHDRDTVFVKQQPELEDGQIGIFIFNGEGYIKQLDRDGHALVSLNKQYRPMVITGADELRIVGRVLGKSQ